MLLNSITRISSIEPTEPKIPVVVVVKAEHERFFLYFFKPLSSDDHSHIVRARVPQRFLKAVGFPGSNLAAHFHVRPKCAEANFSGSTFFHIF